MRRDGHNGRGGGAGITINITTVVIIVVVVAVVVASIGSVVIFAVWRVGKGREHSLW